MVDISAAVDPTSGLPSTIAEAQQAENVGQYIELFTLDASALGGSMLYFTRNPLENGLYATWQGNEYIPIEIEATGFEYSAAGALPQPTVRVSNATGLMATLVLTYKDCIGFPFTRTRTFRQFLDDSPSADPNMHFGVEQYVIEQKTIHNKTFIEFALSVVFDQQGTMLPRRQMLRKCLRQYRRFVVGESFDYSKATCPYQGTDYFDENDQPCLAKDDRCSKNLTGCKLRFPFPTPLPTWAFPGVSRLRV